MYNSSCILERQIQSYESIKNLILSFGGELDEIIMNTKNIYSHYTKNIKVTETIPLISHDIWFTDPKSPREVFNHDLISLNNKIKLLDNQNTNNWKHILWTNSLKSIPKTIDNLAQVNIEIKEINDIDTDNEITDILKALIDKNYFGIATDLARYFLLNKMGGLYSDLNYVILNNPQNLMQEVSFLSQKDKNGVENYFIASKPQHPINLDAQKYTISQINKVFELDLVDCDQYEVTNFISFFPYNIAVLNHINQNNDIDIILSNPIEDHKGDNIYSLGVEEHFKVILEKIHNPIELMHENFGRCYNFTLGYDNKTKEQSWLTDNSYEPSLPGDIKEIND